tara:strand:- start:1852 stop:2112 length:261 start_codon:yes stop_codon:yes gene_type:complete
MSKPILLDPTSRRLLEYVESISDEIRKGEVVGVLTVIVSDNADIRHEAAGLFHDGYAMVGHLEGLKSAMLYMEAVEDDEEYSYDEE